MKIRILFFLLILSTKGVLNAGDIYFEKTAATAAVTTVTREPISLLIKDIYEHLFRRPLQRGIRYLRRVIHYRRVLRWARMWWILLSREIVGPHGHIESKSNRVLRRMWENCAIAVYNSSLNSVNAKPLLFLHAILNECKDHYASKLKNDPDMIVQKIDKILKSEIYRFWVAEEYLNIGQSDILYTSLKPSKVPYVPEKYTLHYVSKFMEDKLKSLESKKDIDVGKYDIKVET